MDDIIKYFGAFENYFRVAAAIPTVTVADCYANANNIIKLIEKATDKKARLVIFPELCTTGYTCADLFLNSQLIKWSNEAIVEIARRTASLDIEIIIGAPVAHKGALYNCAVALYKGKIEAIIPKTYIPNYGEFYERRWWSPGDKFSATDDSDKVFITDELFTDKFSNKYILNISGVNVGVEICEDLWAPIPPSTRLAMAGAEVILNLSASNDVIGKYNYLKKIISVQSSKTITGYVYASAGFGESSTDLVFDGKAIVTENGSIIAQNERWCTEPQLVVTDIDINAIRYDRRHRKTYTDCADKEVNLNEYVTIYSENQAKLISKDILRVIDPMPFVPADNNNRDERCAEITNIQIAGLAKRLVATHCKNLVIGISGGLDSTLALLVAVATFDKLGYNRNGIVGVTMPGFGTTDRTHDNAVKLMQCLGITHREISIVPAVMQHFSDIKHNPNVHDVTYENSQARQRTYLLMDIANQVNGMVLGTGDLSELALGWATYNGDHMSMYGINASIPKTLIKYLVSWYETKFDKTCAAILKDIINTPISPELIPANADGTIKQKTEDLVGPYELHDFFLYHTLRFGRGHDEILALAYKAFKDKYDGNTICHWLDTFFRRFFSQQFKRSCMPDGPKVGSVCLSPRGDWRMPSDASSMNFAFAGMIDHVGKWGKIEI